MSDPRTIPTAVEEAAGAWFARRRSGAMTPAESRALEAWFAEDPRHMEAFQTIELAWAEVEDFRSAPEILAIRERARGRRSGVTRAAVSRMAAAFLGLAVIATGGYGLKVSGVIDLHRFSNQQYATRVGEKTSVTLPDGSVVTLNTDTVLRTRADKGQRLLFLDKGQAYFKVAHDPAHPFVVAAGGRTVTALGTQFDVRVGPREFRVTLVQGKVRVEAPATAVGLALAKAGAPITPGPVQATEMTAGSEFAATDNRHWNVTTTDVDKETSWLRGQLIFERERLGDVAEELNRYSTKKIVVDGDAANIPVTAAFKAGDVDGFVRAVKDYGFVRVVSENNKAVELKSVDEGEIFPG
jgi:transmembrane sensor